MFYIYKVNQHNQFSEPNMKSVSMANNSNGELLSLSDGILDGNLLNRIRDYHNNILNFMERNDFPSDYLHKIYDFIFNENLSKYYFSSIDSNGNRIIVSNYKISFLNDFYEGCYE